MEVVIAASITVILGGIVTQSVISTQKMAVQLEKNLDYKVDTLLSDKIAIKDFRNIAPSLNQLTIRDDAGHPFFDYEPDRMSSFYLGQSTIKRVFTLGVGAKTEFLLLVQDDRRGFSVFADPVMAYAVGAPPGNISTPASLTFEGFNRGAFLATKNSQLLDPKGLLAVDSSAFMPLSSANPRRRAAMFIGYPDPSGNVIKYDLPGGIFDGGIFNPSGSKTTITTLDEFLRNLPPLGSIGSSVRIQPVKLLKYEAVCDGTKCTFSRSELTGNSGEFDKKIIMNTLAKTMSIIRDDIGTTVFRIEFTKPPREYKKK